MKGIKTGGRKKGTPNRTTEEMRNFLQKVIDQKFETLSDDLDMMKPAMRWTIIEKMMKYFLPSLTKNDNDNTESGELKINISYNQRPIDDDKNDDDED